jgi:hypothetical protein
MDQLNLNSNISDQGVKNTFVTNNNIVQYITFNGEVVKKNNAAPVAKGGAYREDTPFNGKANNTKHQHSKS